MTSSLARTVESDTATITAAIAFQAEHERLPSWTELGERLGISRTAAMRRVRGMAACVRLFSEEKQKELAQVAHDTGMSIDFVHAFAVQADRARRGLVRTPPTKERAEPVCHEEQQDTVMFGRPFTFRL